MKPRGVPARILARCFEFWRSERGIGIGEVAVGLALMAAAIAGYQYLSKKVAPLGQAFIPLTNCQLAVDAALKEAEDRRKNHGVTFLADNDPIVVAYTECKAKIAAFSEEVKKANVDAITALEAQIATGLAFAGQCFISEVSPSSRLGTAGAEFTVTVEANLPFSGQSFLPGTITATGAVAGSGVLTHSAGSKWTGQIVFPGAASAHIISYEQPRETFISASGNAAARVQLSPGSGACPPNTNPVPGSDACEILTGGDGTCPAGLTASGGKCYIACQTPPYPQSIVWKIPDPPKVTSFAVAPTEIVKGSTEPVTLSYTVENAASASISPGVGAIETDPKGTTTSTSIVSPPPQTDTEWTLLALGINPAASAAATARLIVKDDPSKTSVAVFSPTANAQISDFTVAVSGVVTPVPAPEFRKAQLLVNGALMNEVSIDAAGNFSGTVPLQNTIALGDILVVGDGAVGVTRCGPVSMPISVSAPFGNGKNGIMVRVPLAGGSASSALVGVEHVVSVHSFSVDWAQTCGPAPSKNVSLGYIMRAAQPAVLVGTVDCGVGGPTHCTDTANITVTTSVGTKKVPQTWTIDVNSCN